MSVVMLLSYVYDLIICRLRVDSRFFCLPALCWAERDRSPPSISPVSPWNCEYPLLLANPLPLLRRVAEASRLITGCWQLGACCNGCLVAPFSLKKIRCVVRAPESLERLLQPVSVPPVNVELQLCRLDLSPQGGGAAAVAGQSAAV